ncbi:MAG: SufE family protein [Planctomycetota bacterium]
MQDITIEELYEEFDDLADSHEQIDYLIDLGMDLPELPDEAKSEENRVHGCMSNVWLVARTSDSSPPVVEFTANSDSMIVSGLIVVVRALYSGKTPKEIASVDAHEAFAKLGLDRHLSTQRRNGLSGMVDRVRQLAVQAEAESAS